MAVNMEDDVQLIMESSWTVCRGSLESCITVVFVDPVSQEPVVPSNCNTERLSLVPAEESVPCEITIKFQGRQCDVQSLYILSTARTYELYSQADLVMDPEYVCTVRGWTPDKGNEAGSSGESLKSTPANCSTNLAPEVMGLKNILDETENGSADLDSGAYPSCKVKEHLIGSASQIINDQTVIHDSVGLKNEDLEKSIYSSGEDSWVDVKFSGSFSGESLSEGSISQSLNGQLDGTHQGRDWLDKHSLEKNSRSFLLADGMQTVCAELNSGSLSTNGCGVPILCEEDNAEHFGRSLVVQENMYEAELELVDHCPWTSLTIRFLSLKGRSCVDVDQMVLLVVPGPPVLKATSSNQSLCGGDSSALLAMFIPSILRMAQGIPNHRPKDASHGLQLNSNPSSNTLRSTVDLATSEKHEKENSRTLCMSTDVNSAANTESTMKNRQDVSMPVENINNENVTKHNIACSTSGAESTLSSIETSEKPLQPGVTVLPEREAGMMNSDKPVEKPLQPVNKVQLACKAGYACPHSCEHGKGSHATNLLLNLDPFLERFDRLEALCMRMEEYIVKAVDKLDQRLKNLEREHTTLPMCMPLEPGHVTSKESCPFSSTPSLPVSPLPSGARCLGAKALDAAESSAWIGTSIYEKADTQETAVEVCILDSSDMNTSTGGSLGAVDEVSKIFQVEVPAPTGVLESRSSAMPDGHGYPEKKPQISLDDAWNSALSAFSSSCIPAHVEVLSDVDSEVQQDISHAMEDTQSCGSQSEVTTSVPCVDLEGTLSMDTQAFSNESPVTSSSGIEKLKGSPQSGFHNHTVDMSFDQVSHTEGEQTIPLCNDRDLGKTETFVSDLQGHDVEGTPSMDAQDFSEESSVTSSFGTEKPKDSPQSGFENHIVDMSFDQVSHREGEQTVPLCKDWSLEKTESFVIDLQGHDANDDPFRSVLQFTVNDNCPSPCSRGERQKILNDDAIFDLMNCLCSINSEQETVLSEIDTLVSDMGKSHLKNMRKANLDPLDLELLNGFSSVPNGLIDVQCKVDGFPSSEIALNNILGEDNLNDLYDTACSESSTCISQDFDTFHDHISDCEWFSSQNLCLVQDIAMTDNDISKQGLDFEEILFMNSNYSNSSSRHLTGAPLLHSFFDLSLSEPHLLDVDLAPQQQLTGHTNFPGFEDIL